MDDDVKAKNLLIGIGMKIKAFNGTNKDCAEDVNKFFHKKNVEIHDIKISTSNEKSTYSGDMLVIITYTEIS